jgi:phosphate-selective porin OprO/OprP
MRTELAIAALILLVSGATQVSAVELTPSGRLHLDYAVHDSDVAQFDDRFLVRRAQLGLEAKWSGGWSAKLAYDFASGGSLKDAYLRYGGWKPAAFSIGQFKIPFGLEDLESTNDLTFIERSLPSAAFSLSRRKGVGLESQGKNHTFAVMGFGSSVGGNQGAGFGARFTFTPFNQDNSVLHLGVSATSERPTDRVRFSARPESLPTDPRLVNTGTINAVTRINQVGLEAGYKHGPLSIQGEYMGAHLTRDSSRPDLTFHGWYLAGSWVLTGESRGYKDGAFKGIEAAAPSGAWELTARISRISLDDGKIEGGKEDNFTLGVNWYLRDHLRIMANYINADSNRRGVSDNPEIFEMRLQLAF